jgi:hypothetical protein
VASLTHDQQSAPGDLEAGVRIPDSARSVQTFSAVRSEFSARAAAMFDGVLLGLSAKGDHRASNRAIAKTLGRDEKRVRMVRSGEAVLLVGDILAMATHPETREVARLIVAAIDLSIAPAVTRLPLDRAPATIGASFGKFCSDMIAALADGVLDGAEPAALKSALRSIISQCEAAIREIDARVSAPLAKAAPREVATKLGVGRTAGGGR